MCGIWDWQSTIIKDLNDSQDPQNTLFCRENAFVAIYALFSDNKCPLFTRLGGGVAQSGHCPLFLPFFLYDGFPKLQLQIWSYMLIIDFQYYVLQEGLPGVYSNVSAHREWIDANIQNNGGGDFCDS